MVQGPPLPLWLAFDQDDIELMSTALEAAWNALRCDGSPLAAECQARATRAMLARRILAAAQAGEMTYGQLLMRALDGVLIDESDGAATFEAPPHVALAPIFAK